MFLTLLDDGCIHVYASPAAAATHIEALDVDLVVRAAFDDEARPYRAEWITPNTHGKLLGVVPWVANGEYRFVVSGERDAPGLIAVIRGAVAVLPDAQSQWVRDLERRLTERSE
jgi:hypothetical protein